MCPFSTTLLLLAAACALFYAFLVWNFGYWRKRGIKEAKSYPFFGSFPSLFTQKRNVFYDIDDLYRKYKKTESIVGVFTCRSPELLILDPEYAHKIFVNDFKSFHDNEFSRLISPDVDAIFANNPFVLTGEQWKERRTEVTPGLTANRVSAAFPVTLEVSKAFVNYIKSEQSMRPKDGLNAKEICLRYTTEVVSDCVLGIKAGSFSNNPTPIYSMIKRVFDQSVGFFVFTTLSNLFPQIRKIYTPRLFPKVVQDFFYGLMDTSIDLRRKNPQNDRIDFLNYILQLQEKKHLNNKDLTAHTMTFLTDGFETTALVLSHTLYLLAKTPEAQKKLRTEIGTKQLTFEELNDLPYLEACFHETLRLFTSVPQARKLCTEPYEFVNKDGTKVKVKKGDVVIVASLSIQKDPDIYEDPETYKPERFLPENGGAKKYRDMGAYLGFGDGPRICLGMRFAMTQMKAALVEIVRKFDIKLNPKTRLDNTLDDTYFMASLKGGMWLEFEERN